jgi:uncharacterized damage-inducible protein DinB
MNIISPVAVLQDFTPMMEAQMETPELIAAAQDVLMQGLGLLFELNDRTYSHAVTAPFDASIGQHYRHILEHFHSLIKGLRAGEINYDARERNPRLQGEVTYASIATCDVLRALKRYSEETLARRCKVINSVGYGTSNPSTFESNISRELAYCVGHAIHHYAIVRLICHEIGMTVPVEFGVAPSTLKHMASLAAG